MVIKPIVIKAPNFILSGISFITVKISQQIKTQTHQAQYDNKHTLAFKKKEDITYLQLKNNRIIGIVGDNSYLIFGIGQKPTLKASYDISGFLTNFKPLIEILYPRLSKIILEAKPPKEIQLNKGFNDIIENHSEISAKILDKIKPIFEFHTPIFR